jgi:hypothetical protein
MDEQSGDTNYKNYRTRTLLGYETVYKQVNQSVEVCSSYLDGESKNVSVCVNETNIIKRQKDNITGPPVYKYSEIEEIEVDGNSYLFESKGCWICDEHIACLSKKDGYSPYRGAEFKCNASNYPIIRGGESGWIQHVFTQEIKENRSDVGRVE